MEKWENGGIAPLVFNLGIRCGWVVSFTSGDSAPVGRRLREWLGLTDGLRMLYRRGTAIYILFLKHNITPDNSRIMTHHQSLATQCTNWMSYVIWLWNEMEFLHMETILKEFCLTNILNLLKPACYLMHQQFNNQQLYVLPTLYLFVLYLSQNKQRLVPLTA